MTALRLYTSPKRLVHALRVINTTMAGLVAQTRLTTYPRTPREMLAMEQRERSLTRSIADLSIAKKLLLTHQDVEVRRQASAASRRCYRERGITRPIREKGWSWVTIVLPGGLRRSFSAHQRESFT